uniref:Exonuclease domain-containing protein n=1 Tax=Parascaris equorum TaxID=6256 RepID=A0A914S3Q7_PAREQ
MEQTNLSCALQVDTFHSHVRPRINPKLSEFCSRLTGVTQEMVDNALPFVDVFDSSLEMKGTFRINQA